jgi:hypothetical protein
VDGLLSALGGDQLIGVKQVSGGHMKCIHCGQAEFLRLPESQAMNRLEIIAPFNGWITEIT